MSCHEHLYVASAQFRPEGQIEYRTGADEEGADPMQEFFLIDKKLFKSPPLGSADRIPANFTGDIIVCVSTCSSGLTYHPHPGECDWELTSYALRFKDDCLTNGPTKVRRDLADAYDWAIKEELDVIWGLRNA